MRYKAIFNTVFSSILFLLMLGVSACTLHVKASTPEPNVLIPAEKSPARLDLSPAVKDEYDAEVPHGVKKTKVTGWRKTLTAGFHNAFPEAGASNLTLRFLKAKLVLVLENATIKFQIRYQVQVVSSDGTVVAQEAGTASAPGGVVRTTGCTDNAKQAVEVMYEQIAKKLLDPKAKPSAEAEAPAKSE